MGVQKGQNYEHNAQLSPMLVNTMKAQTCNMKRSQRHSNHAQISRTSHTQVEMSHTKKSRTFFLGGSAN